MYLILFSFYLFYSTLKTTFLGYFDPRKVPYNENIVWNETCLWSYFPSDFINDMVIKTLNNDDVYTEDENYAAR